MRTRGWRLPFALVALGAASIPSRAFGPFMPWPIPDRGAITAINSIKTTYKLSEK